MRLPRDGRRRRAVVAALGLGLALLLLAHPAAGAASDVWSNVGPASPLGPGGLFGDRPLSRYMLDQHFDAVSASLTGGIDVSGVPPMIAYFLASVLWSLTAFLANALITLFAFAFGLDLLNGSGATGGAGALGPVARAIHAIYASAFGAPWLIVAVAVTGIWAMWRALVQRRYTETAGALGLSLLYVTAALFFVAMPAKTIGAASEWTNRMSVAFLAIASEGGPSGGTRAREAGAEQLFELLIFKPWVVLEFGGLEHCVRSGTGSGESDPESVAVRPLSSEPSRDAELARRLQAGSEVAADGKVCVNNARKYASHFLRFGLGTEERDAEYDALDHGDSSRLPEADPERRGYRLGVADKPATDAMEVGGQYQRLLLAIVLFCGELGAFCLLGALSVGVILAQVLLLLALAFAPVALVAAAIPGRGHAFFRGWLEKLAGYLLRKAAYSLVLAVLLAVCGALASATSELGWLMSFGLQALFFWAVFLQRKALSEGLVGIATGAGAPGREATLRVLGLYYGARLAARPLRSARRGARAAGAAPRRVLGSAFGSRAQERPSARPRRAPRSGTFHSRPVGFGAPPLGSVGVAQAPAGDSRPRRREAGRGGALDRAEAPETLEPAAKETGRVQAATSEETPAREASAAKPEAKGPRREGDRAAEAPAGEKRAPGSSPKRPSAEERIEPARQRRTQPRQAEAEPVRLQPEAEQDLETELRAERERLGKASPKAAGEKAPGARPAPPHREDPQREGGGR